MARLFKKRYHPPGTAPGTLIEHAPAGNAARITAMIYDAQETHLLPETALERLPEPKEGEHLWVHVQETPDARQLNQLGGRFGLHPLALEDVANVGQRPKNRPIR